MKNKIVSVKGKLRGALAGSVLMVSCTNQGEERVEGRPGSPVGSARPAPASARSAEPAQEVSDVEAQNFARKQGMMYIEASAKDRTGIQQTFEEVVQKILDTPSLLDSAGSGGFGPGGGGGVRIDDDSDASASYCSYC